MLDTSPESRPIYQSISPGKPTSHSISKSRHSIGVALTRNPSLSTISSKSAQAPAVIIKHGLPSPPPTVRSDNGSWVGKAAAIQPDACLLKIQPPSVRSHLTNTTNYTVHPSPLNSGHSKNPPLRSSPVPTSNHLYSEPLTSANPHARRSAREIRRSSWAFVPMKVVKDQLSQASAAHQLQRSGSTHSHQKFSRTSITRPATSSSPLSATSNQSPSAHGPMPSSSFHLQSTPSSKHQDLTSRQVITNLSTSILSNATVRPKIRTPSESSSTDLRVSKLKFKDRSKDISVATLNEESQGTSRSKKLATMKERNERIFASINASLNPPSSAGSVEPPLPPPPPSSSSRSPTPPPGSMPSSASEALSHLKAPPIQSTSSSGLIPFAQGSSPNPRKVTGCQPHATTDRIDPSLLASSVMDSDNTDDDEHFGSVRHKRPERCKLVKRTSISGSTTNLLKHKPPPSETGSTGSQEDDWTKHVPPRNSRYSGSTPMSAHIDKSHLPSDGRSEAVSMHTTSSDTIGGHGRSGVVARSSSRNSIISYHTDFAHARGNHSDEDENDVSGDQSENHESLITPVKFGRAESFQKTLRHANSVSEMLHPNDDHGNVGPAARTPRATTSARHRRSSSSHHRQSMLAATEKISSTTFSPQQSNSTSLLSNSQGITRSPQSHASLSRHQRPALPDQFVLSHRPDRSDHEIHSMAQTHPSVLSSSLSPRSNRTRLIHSSSMRQPSNVDNRSYRHSDTYVSGLDRLNGVESALSRYDGHHSFSDRRKYATNRNKHASWSVLEELVKDLPRSQSVLGGAYDPRITESREVPIRPRTSYLNPLSRRYASHRANGLEEDDDDQTSTTTYTNVHSMPRKPSSADSRSRTSDLGFEDQEHCNRSIHSTSRLGGHTSSLYMSPSGRKSTLEHDRTLRGNIGAVVPTPKPFTQLLRNTYQEKNSYNADALSSSSGTTSSKRLQSLRSTNHGPSPSVRMNDSGNRHSRPPTRSASMAAIGLTALLSPTPAVDHHNLLISAYEALDCHQEEHTTEARDLQSVLNGLLSSVVKNSCKIDATLTKLNESSLNHQVEMELADDYIDDAHKDNLSSKQSSSEHITRKKYFMMKDSLAQMAKVQGQLVRTSNDHMRDLTEVLICLSKLHRTQKEPPIARPTGMAASRGGDDSRESHGFKETNPNDYVRSGSRAGAGYSRSHSPSKLRHTIDLSPLSVISSHDGSPLAKDHIDSSYKAVGHSQRLVSSSTRSRAQHNRASTISFAHQRYLSIDGLSPRAALSCTSIKQMRDEPMYHQQSNSQASVSVDEFGLYRQSSEQTLRSPLEFKYPNQEESWPKAESTRNTIRGSQPSVVFPKTPPRIATASLSHAIAHSNVSPTRPHRDSIESRSQRVERDVGVAMRPSSSMSKVLDRANYALSRTGNYPTVSAVHSGRRENVNNSERHSKGALPEDARISNRRNENSGRMSVADIRMNSEHSLSSRQIERKKKDEQHRSSSTATAALERLSLTRASGAWNGGHSQHHQRNEEVRKPSGSTSITCSHLHSSNSTGTSNDARDSELDDTVELRRDFASRQNYLPPPPPITTIQPQRRTRKGSIHKFFGIKKNHAARN